MLALGKSGVRLLINRLLLFYKTYEKGDRAEEDERAFR